MQMSGLEGILEEMRANGNGVTTQHGTLRAGTLPKMGLDIVQNGFLAVGKLTSVIHLEHFYVNLPYFD